MKHFLLLTIAAAGLMAADATGKWTGSLLVPTPDGEQARPAHLVLKQEGATLTGSAGPDASEQHPIQNGKVEDGKLVFEVATGSNVMKFALNQDGDEIKGDISRERDGQRQNAKLVVKREK